MWPFQRNRLDDRVEKLVAQLREDMDELRRIVRNCDGDVSDALEKMQRLQGRMAKRRSYTDEEAEASPSAGPGRDPISQKILERRARTGQRAPSLAEEQADGVLPKR